MDLGLSGKVAVVTGASRGIGRAIAGSLAAEGCRLALCARGEADLERAAAELTAAGAEVVALPLDVTAPDAPDRLLEAAAEAFGRVDILVSNVGGSTRKPFAETTDEDWRDLVELNFSSAVRWSRTAIPYLRARGDGVEGAEGADRSILFVASIWGREAAPAGMSLYQTTKSALVSLAKAMARELAPDGIRVVSVAPGSIRFPGGSWDRRVRADPEGMARFVDQHLPLGRFGRAEEVGDVVAFLASPRASLVTGASVVVDGCQSWSLI